MIKWLSLIFLSAFLCIQVKGQDYPERPNPPQLVNDFTGTLSGDEVNRLEQKLDAYHDSTSTQLAIVMIHTLDGYPTDEYAIGLAENWGIGTKGKDNGVLIFIALDDHQIFIPTGYGMEGVLTDSRVKYVIENDLKPAFRNQSYYEGLNLATDHLMQMAAGEFKSDGNTSYSSKNDTLIIVGILLFIILGLLFKIQQTKSYARVNQIGFWAAWMILNRAGRPHQGHWGGFSGRSSGGGGGGFGGFGGGSFGGGGAGGSW